jgi:hypothetical protein
MYIISQKYRCGCKKGTTSFRKYLPKIKDVIKEATIPTIILGIAKLKVNNNQNINDNINKARYFISILYYQVNIIVQIN